MINGDYVTLAELAKLLGVVPDSLRQRIHRGTLQATKKGNTWLVRRTVAMVEWRKRNPDS